MSFLHGHTTRRLFSVLATGALVLGFVGLDAGSAFVSTVPGPPTLVSATSTPGQVVLN